MWVRRCSAGARAATPFGPISLPNINGVNKHTVKSDAYSAALMSLPATMTQCTRNSLKNHKLTRSHKQTHKMNYSVSNHSKMMRVHSYLTVIWYRTHNELDTDHLTTVLCSLAMEFAFTLLVYTQFQTLYCISRNSHLPETAFPSCEVPRSQVQAPQHPPHRGHCLLA